MGTSKPDVVVPLRASLLGQGFEELRFAMRSLDRHEPNSELWLLGGRPKWISRQVNHIPLNQNAAKYQNVRRMIHFACNEPAISDPFVLSNDDITWLLPGTPILHGGPMRAYLDTMKSRVGNSSYVRGGYKSLEMVGGGDEINQFSLHTPILVYKDAMREAIKLVGDTHEPLHLRSIYAAIQGLEGVEHCDVKIVSSKLPPKSWHYVSTSDVSFQHQAVGAYIRSRFPAKSRYES